MRPLESALMKRGYAVANVDYPSRLFEVEALADLAVKKGLVACEDKGASKVHFISHSLGGVLIRVYLSGHQIPKLGRVVMLAPPNQGSEVVDKFADFPGFKFINGPAGEELGTIGAQSIPLSLGPVTYPVGVIAGTRSVNWILSSTLPNPDDGKLSLERTKVEGMSDFVSMPVSHPFIMRNKDVIRQTVHFIENGKFDHALPQSSQSTRGVKWQN